MYFCSTPYCFTKYQNIPSFYKHTPVSFDGCIKLCKKTKIINVIHTGIYIYNWKWNEYGIPSFPKTNLSPKPCLQHTKPTRGGCLGDGGGGGGEYSTLPDNGDAEIHRGGVGL